MGTREFYTHKSLIRELENELKEKDEEKKSVMEGQRSLILVNSLSYPFYYHLRSDNGELGVIAWVLRNVKKKVGFARSDLSH